MRDEYFLNPQKAALAVTVANAEYKIMKHTAQVQHIQLTMVTEHTQQHSKCSFLSQQNTAE